MAYPRFFTRTNKDFDESATVHYVMNLARKDKLQGSTKIKVDTRYFNPRIVDKRRFYADLKIAEELGLEDQAKKEEKSLLELGNNMVTAWKDVKKNNYANPVDELDRRVGLMTGKYKPVIETTRKLNLLELIDRYIEIKGAAMRNDKSVTSYYPNLKKRLQAFEQHYETKLEYKHINQAFKEMFFDDFVEEPRYYKGKKLSKLKQNTKHTLYRRFSALLTFGVNGKHHSNEEYKNFSIPNTKPKKVYLTPKDIQSLKDIYLEGSQDKIRDIFLLCLETGARIEDALAFNTDDNLNPKYIYWEQQKTGEIVTQKITDEMTRLFHKYGNRFPNETDPVKYFDVMESLKPICKEAGINDLVTVDKEEGKVEKWTKVGSHTARVTKCTNMRLANRPWEDIRKILGHTTVETSKGYFHATTDDIRAIIKESEEV